MLRLLFPDDPAGAASGGAPVEESTDSTPEAGESITPAEVKAAVKSSGIDLPDEPVAADEEEGVDPDAPAAEEEQPETPDEEQADEEEPETEEKPEAKPQRQAPEDVTADEDKYSFEVTDANGVTFKIAAGATMEDILKEFEPTNNGQIMDILHKLDKVENQKTTDEAKAAEDQANTERQTRASELLKSWDSEAKDLQASKRIEQGEDGTKRINEVYKYMADENTKRMEAGKPTLNSFEDALDKLEAKEGREAKVAQDKADKETARANGSKVGGSSAPATSETPIYKAGSARNANDAIRLMKLIK